MHNKIIRTLAHVPQRREGHGGWAEEGLGPLGVLDGLVLGYTEICS